MSTTLSLSWIRRCAILCLFAAPHLAAQDFVPPVDFKMLLSGTFGELRPNHFHSGIDIRTGGEEGKPIYSIAGGHVSRIFISPSGFGKAVYIDHPGGYTSVYAHLQAFEGEIAAYAEARQYEKESFAIDVQVPAGRLKVSQGEVVARSGNSGTSGGPHLHFEIRDARTEEPLDPMKQGIVIKDWIRPAIKSMKVYPEGPGSRVNDLTSPLTFPIHGWGPVHRLDLQDTLRVAGAVSFGLQVYDLLNESDNQNGVASIQAYLDSLPFYAHSMERFAFSETRYINSMIDYAEYRGSGKRFQRTRIDPNNRLRIYPDARLKGIIQPTPGIHTVRFVVTDHNDNQGILEFPILVNPPLPAAEPACPGRILSWKTDHRIREEGMELSIPGEALYDSICFSYSSGPGAQGTFGRLHRLNDERVPLHTHCTLRLEGSEVPVALRSRTLLVKVDARGRRSDAGGQWEDGWVKGRIREFGTYAIAVDTLAPRLAPLNFSEGGSMQGKSQLLIRLSDDLSGIASYRAEINGKWILMEYDAKVDLLILEVRPEQWLPGNNTLELSASDDAGNASKLTFNLIY
ncbi:MAG TPA: M23 family metallopeptidase [Bacteroidales bacterium]|nr:M23 family metallopeptidase [Bacteroidales bacterium]